MNPKSKKRNTSILVKITQQEKEQIEKNAAAFVGNVSDFILHQSLSPDEGSTAGAKLQAIARELCRLCEITKNPNADQLRCDLEEWSESIWQFMK